MDANDAEDMDSAALDKECSALSALFQQIINEMKVSDVYIPAQSYNVKLLFH